MVVPVFSGLTYLEDTIYYWKLSENIYRYNHGNGLGDGGLGNIHTVNESRSTPQFVILQLIYVHGRSTYGQLV